MSKPDASYSERFPHEIPCRVRLFLRDGRVLGIEKWKHKGFHTNPLPWDRVVAKFKHISKPYADSELQLEIIEAIGKLELLQVEYLIWLLETVQPLIGAFLQS